MPAFSKNRETRFGTTKIEGYHFYNEKTEFDVFFNIFHKENHYFRTEFILNQGQEVDFQINENVT